MTKFFFLLLGALLLQEADSATAGASSTDYAPPFFQEKASIPDDQIIAKDNKILSVDASVLAELGVQVAAVVNNRIITTNDLEERMRMLIRGDLSQIPPHELKKIQLDVLRQMIDEKLQTEITENAKITITDNDISTAIRYMEEQNNLEAGSVEKDLTAKNISKKTIRDHFGTKIAWSRLIGYYRDTIEVGQKDLSQRTKRTDVNEKTYLLAEIVFQFDSSMDEDRARSKALQTLNRLREGEGFGQVAYEISDSPSAANGGDIGWVPLSQCSALVQETLNFLKPGELSQPIRDGDAYRILLVRNIHYPDARAQTMTARQLEIKLPKDMSEEDRGKEKEKLDGLFSTIEGCEQFDLLEDQLGGELNIYKDVSLPDLSEDLQDALKDLSIGQASTGYMNQDSIVYFMVCEKRLAKIQEVNQEVKTDELIDQRLSAFADQKLRDMRRVAAIDIRL